ncbi:DNA-binding LacI/PurR family transcriptional regulator [Spinactinospora alkalitolerans]|uniref:DNA-binding LacI/PurR family transcriptional regulator n=1 Tax=Spinactinospora alkalitolerans TaxID=687207 RepID=A0A852TSD6_9ACTN|nr:LacI family DNA-binding transcriptional regulator [Spinactinospora alkalitolerans]NYE46858.1 DNA-binding LacI/PurR family transcriptional regulator [Spinactinospora alkalitolerans]
MSVATRPRIKDVARRAGVSEKTVSNVINDYPHVTEKTRGAVREAIAELGYRVNLTGRHLRRGRTGIIALVLPELDQDYFAEIAKHIIKEAESRSTTVLVHQTEGRRDRELAALDGFDADFADGLIFSPLTMAHDDLRRHRARLPVVLLGERTAPGLHDHVAIDNVAAAREATEHLLGLGRRRIAVLGGRLGPDLGTAELRTQGHREAIEAAGLEFDPALVRPAGAFLWQDGAELTEELLSSAAPRPDALLCLNDHLALGAVRTLHEAGVAVPDEIAVVGFDGIAAGRYSLPSLTTVAPDKPFLARGALDLLLSRLEGAERPPGEIVVPHTLVVRESSAA